MEIGRTLGLFAITAAAEIAGCYAAWLHLRQGWSAWILVPGALCLFLFAWLLTLHPTAAGRAYAAYGGVYVGGAILWLWLVDGQTPDRWDLIGAAVTLVGMGIIAFVPRN